MLSPRRRATPSGEKRKRSLENGKPTKTSAKLPTRRASQCAGISPNHSIVVANRFGRQGCRVEHEAIDDHRCRTDLAHRREDVLGLVAAVAGEVEVARRPVQRSAPQREQRGALEHVVVAVRRLTESVEEPLGGVALQRELHVLATFAYLVAQPLSDRLGGVFLALLHDSASKYTRITLRARHISAARTISSTLALRERTASRSASSATSRPSLLR